MALALVTGASSGIGRHLAEELAKRGFDVVITARAAAELEALRAAWEPAYGVRVHPMACDLAEPGAPERLYAELRRTLPPPDVLVNNAGVGLLGRFVKQDWPAIERVLRLNAMALTALTHPVLNDMLARGSGRILNVSSCAAFSPGPRMAVYFATKTYVLHFSEALAEECAGSGVTVTALCPGATLTSFHTAAGFKPANRLFTSWLASDADFVARHGLRALFAGRRIAVPGLLNHLSLVALRVAPRWLALRVTQKVLKP